MVRRKIYRNAGKSTRSYKPYKMTPRQLRPTRTTRKRRQSSTTTTSFLNMLPAEVFDLILDKMSVREISTFSMVSKKINSYIVNYISTMAWKNKMILHSFHNCTSLEQKATLGQDLGLLFKRCTLLLPTKDRLKFVFSKFSQIPCFILEQCLTPDCTGFSSYGAFLQTLIAGWDELECHRVFNFLCDLTNLLPKTEAVITARPGVKSNEEMQLRLFCRQVLLDPWPDELQRQFWLMQLLKSWPMVGQAHLLFILYGPLRPEFILGWQDLVERGLPHSVLWDLAKAIHNLSGSPEIKGWTVDTMLTILEELFAIPEPWHLENVARLLVMCGSSLCYTVLASKAINGRLLEISRLIVFIVLVCGKDGYQMSWAVKLVQQICKLFRMAPEKFRFIQHLESTFSEVILEFVVSASAGNGIEDRETFQALRILLNSSAHFHTKFLCRFLK